MIIEEHYWQIEESNLVIGMTISGENVEWIIPLEALGRATPRVTPTIIEVGREDKQEAEAFMDAMLYGPETPEMAQDGQRDLSSVNLPKRLNAAVAAIWRL